jgi:integrase/recombinase XerD
LLCDFIVHPIRWDRCPLVAADPHARSWLTIQSHRGLAYNTLNVYSRALEPWNATLASWDHAISLVYLQHADVGFYLASLQSDGARLSNATIQQLLTVVRLFHTYLMEEGVRSNNPVEQSYAGRAMIARHHKLPRIPNEEDWHSVFAAARREPIGNRVMLAFADDAGLRREELCSLRGDDITPSRRTLRVRAAYSASSSELLLKYLQHRRTLGRKRGRFFLSESRRNYTEPISIWSWSKVVLTLARRAQVKRLNTHKLRTLCPLVPVGTFTRSPHLPATAVFRPRFSISTSAAETFPRSLRLAWLRFMRDGPRCWRRCVYEPEESQES